MTTVGQILAAGLLASAIMSFLVIVPTQSRFHPLALCVIASAGAAAVAFYVHSGRQTEEAVAFGAMLAAFVFAWLTVVGALSYVVARSLVREWTRIGERVALSIGMPTLLFSAIYLVGSFLNGWPA